VSFVPATRKRQTCPRQFQNGTSLRFFQCLIRLRYGLLTSTSIHQGYESKIGVSANSDFYLCGPSSFMQDMRDGLQNWGVPAGSVHAEIFGTLAGIAPGMAPANHTPHILQGPQGAGPSVSFARSGITVAWDRKFGSLLELAEARPWSFHRTLDCGGRWRIGCCGKPAGNWLDIQSRIAKACLSASPDGLRSKFPTVWNNGETLSMRAYFLGK
jgi:hypothetical protein